MSAATRLPPPAARGRGADERRACRAAAARPAAPPRREGGKPRERRIRAREHQGSKARSRWRAASVFHANSAVRTSCSQVRSHRVTTTCRHAAATSARSIFRQSRATLLRRLGNAKLGFKPNLTGKAAAWTTCTRKWQKLFAHSREKETREFILCHPCRCRRARPTTRRRRARLRTTSSPPSPRFDNA